MASPFVVSTELLTNLLRDVSRSFYKTLRLLPPPIRDQIGLAYLLARTTDTIADTAIVPAADRLEALDRLKARILGESSEPLDLSLFMAEGQLRTDPQGSDAEKMLLLRVEDALGVLDTFPDADRDLIRDVLTTITGGQALDLQRFGAATGEDIVSLANDEELDDYTYRVAGCVGEFWTRMCRLHLFPDVVVDERFLMKSGVRFGKGLQLVNILRDLPRDLRQGRCYLPREALAVHGLTPGALINPTAIGRFRNLYDAYLRRAEEHLRAGWNYISALPRGQFRLRLACALPVLIGVKTLGRLRTGNVLDARRRIKISRPEVRGLLLRLLICYPSATAWDGLFNRARH